MARRMHPTNSLMVRRDGSTMSAIALQHELQLPLLLGLLDNQSHNQETLRDYRSKPTIMQLVNHIRTKYARNV